MKYTIKTNCTEYPNANLIDVVRMISLQHSKQSYCSPNIYVL